MKPSCIHDGFFVEKNLEERKYLNDIIEGTFRREWGKCK